MAHLSTKTTYLEMIEPVEAVVDPPCAGTLIERCVEPTAKEYRLLYNAVGGDYQWIDRNLVADDELECVVQHDLIEIYVLHVDGEQAGFAELDRRQPGQIELAYFGLFPDFIGKGLGKYFLRWVINRAWSYAPRRVWVHTCDLDHPAALPNYRRAGFVVYDEQVIQQVIKDNDSPADRE